MRFQSVHGFVRKLTDFTVSFHLCFCCPYVRVELLYASDSIV